MCFKCQGTLWCLGVSGLVIRIYSETIHFYNYYHSPIVFSKKVSFYGFFLLSYLFLSQVARTRHFWRRVGVGHRNGYDSPNSGVRRVSSFFSFFFRFSDTRRHGFDAAPTRPTRQQWRKKGGISQILRNPPLKFSTHPPSDLCRCPLSLAGARSGRSASSIGIEWRRALSLPVISLSRHGQQVRPPLSVPRRSKIGPIGKLHRHRVTPCPVPSDDLSLSLGVDNRSDLPLCFFFFFSFGFWWLNGNGSVTNLYNCYFISYNAFIYLFF